MIDKFFNILKISIVPLIAILACDESQESPSENKSVVTYGLDVSEILLQNCTYCHSTALATGGVVLDTYEDSRTVGQTGQLMGALTHADGFTAMPPNAPMLPAEDIDQIRIWIETGFAK